MRARLDLEWEYLSLSLSLARLVDELAFLGFCGSLGGVVALFRQPGLARFLAFGGLALGLMLGGAYEGRLGFLGIARFGGQRRRPEQRSLSLRGRPRP